MSMISELDRQIKELIQETGLKLKDHIERVTICSNIRQLLIDAGYTDSHVYPFGSSVNGLGSMDSDLDLHIDLGSPGKTMEIYKIVVDSNTFKHIEAVPNARVPIVKAVHVPSGISCDLSFGNKASLWNTEFIQFCCLSDPRVRPLIMVVRYWGRMHCLVGREGCVRMCNYALTMLVIAYLQQIPCPILHSVQQLLMCTDVDLAPSSFCSHLLANAHKLPVLHKSTLSISDLLLGFFNHYRNFDYSNSVISIFFGRTCRKDLFCGGNILPIKKPFCVQDPFELNFNICRNITEDGLIILKCNFYEAAEKIYQLKTQPNSLIILFHPCPHMFPKPGCNGCKDGSKTQNQCSELYKYYPASTDDYQMAVLSQGMPPWWRKWRGMC